MVQVTEINELTGLVPLRAAWRALLKQTPSYSFFQSLEWLEVAWPSYPHPQKLRVLVVERDDAPVGIVPFCVRTERRRLGRLRVLTYPMDDWGTFYGPISAEPELAYRAALEHIARTPRDWDVIDLRYVDQAAPEFLSIGDSLRSAGFDFVCRPRMEVRLLDMTRGWDAYVKSRSRNWRQKMRRDADGIERAAGELQYLRYRPAPGEGSLREHDDVYDVCEQVSKNSWQAAADSQSTLCSPRVRDVLHQLHRAAAELGMLDVNILSAGGRPLAFNYNYFADGRVYGLRAGFDGTAGVDNCGKVLLYKMLEDSFARGDVLHSFGPGRQEYKDRYATEMRYAYTFRHYARRSLRSQLLNLRERAASRLLSEAAVIEKGLVS